MSNERNTGKIERVFASYDNFADAERADEAYYRSLNGAQRLEIALDLMASFYAAHPRFERIYRVTELKKDPVSDRWGLGIADIEYLERS